MELRCDCRSTNISETSRFEYSIIYLLRLMAISSTENAQCGVLPPVWIIYLSTGLTHVALPASYHDHSSIFRNIFGDRSCARLSGGSDGRLEGGGRCRQHPRRRMQRRHVGRGVMGKSARR